MLAVLLSPDLSWGASSHPQNRLVIGTPFGLSRINPFSTTSTLSGNIVELIYDPLINLNSSYDITPLLAESWSVSPDQLQWTFKLQDKAKFHDGHVLSAKDVQFTFNVLLKQQSDNAYSARNISTVTATDEHTITFSLKKRDQSFPMFLRRVYIVPSHLFTENGEPASEEYYQHPVGSGAFAAAAVSESEVLLKANADYFLGKPRLEEILFKVFDSEKHLMSKLISGEIDIHVFFDYTYLPALRDIPHLQQMDYLNQHLFALFLNFKNPLFQDRLVRKALNHGILKKRLQEKLIQNNGQIAASVTSPLNYYYNPDVEPYEDNPQLAMELLQQAGWTIAPKTRLLTKGGQTFHFKLLIVEGSPFLEKTVQMILEDLSQLGISVEVQTLPIQQAMVKIFSEKDYDSAIFPYSNIFPIDFDHSLWTQSKANRFNFTSYENPAIADWLVKAREATTKEESLAAYREFQKSIHDDPPMIFLFWRNLKLICHTRVHGLNSNPFRFFTDIDQAWIEPKP